MEAIVIIFQRNAYIFCLPTKLNKKIVEKLASKYFEIPGGYTVRLDRGRVPGCKDNIHVFRHGGTIAAFNNDGTSHDNWRGIIPRRIANFVQDALPYFQIPPDRLVEATDAPECIEMDGKAIVFNLDRTKVIQVPFGEEDRRMLRAAWDGMH